MHFLCFTSIIIVLNLSLADAKLKIRYLLDDTDDLSAPLSFDAGDVDIFNWDSSSLELSGPNMNIFSDATPQQSSCAGQNSPSTEQSPLLVRKDLCPQPLPISPETLQLFEDPNGALDRILSPQNSEEEGSSSTEKKYPGPLTPEEEKERERTSEDGADFEGWDPYQGTITYDNSQREHPCGFNQLWGFIYALCCTGPLDPDDISIEVNYVWLEGCDLHEGMFLTKEILISICFYFSNEKS